MPALKDKYLKNYELLAATLREDFEEPEIEKIYKVIYDLPTLNVDLALRGMFQDSTVDRPVKQPPGPDTWLPVHANQEYVLRVNLTRIGQRTVKSIHCPKFPKGKDEGWFLNLGNQYDGDLIALKRIGYKTNQSSHQLTFVAPPMKGSFMRFLSGIIYIHINIEFFRRPIYLHFISNVRRIHRTRPAVQHST